MEDRVSTVTLLVTSRRACQNKDSLLGHKTENTHASLTCWLAGLQEFDPRPDYLNLESGSEGQYEASLRHVGHQWFIFIYFMPCHAYSCRCRMYSKTKWSWVGMQTSERCHGHVYSKSTVVLEYSFTFILQVPVSECCLTLDARGPPRLDTPSITVSQSRYGNLLSTRISYLVP